MMLLLSLLAIWILVAILTYRQVALAAASSIVIIAWLVLGAITPAMLSPWLVVPLAVILVVLNVGAVRRAVLTKPVFGMLKKTMPPISATERDALEAGTTWWEKQLFSGRPDWNEFAGISLPQLTAEEQSFIDNEVSQLCALLDEWKIQNDLKDLPPEAWQFLKDKNFFGLIIPKEYGGRDFSPYAQSRIMSKIASRSGTAAVTAMVPNSLGPGELLVKYGTEEQRQEWLPRLAGCAIASFGLTEPGSGSDSARMRTRAVRDGADYVLNGTKRYITNAPMAEFILVMARTTTGNLPSNAHVSGFLVPMDTPGISVGRPDRKMGQQGALTADVVFEDVRVPASALLGGVEGRGFKTAMKALDGGRLGIAAAATGYARRILDTALRYATEREAFGEPISGFQLIQAMLADSQTDLYACESMLRDATARAARGEAVSLQAACAKLFASEACGRIADRTVQIYGGAGYMAEYDAERFYRDVRVYRIYEGTSQIMQLVIAKAMLKSFAAL